MPSTDFWHLTNTISLVDRRGCSRNELFGSSLVLYDLIDAIDINGAERKEKLGAGSDGVANVVLEDYVTPKESTPCGEETLIDLSSNGSDDECAIVYSILRNSVQRMGVVLVLPSNLFYP